MSRWEVIADACEQIMKNMLAAWQCSLPSYDVLPSQLLEERVDEWCRRFSDAPTDPLDPPAEVRPWIAARLLCASLLLRTKLLNPSPGATRELVREMLIEQWHSTLRDQWPLLMDLEEDED